MSTARADHPAWADAVWAATLLAIAPAAMGGVALRAGAGPVRDTWLRMLQELLPEGTPWRKLPAHITDDRLLGGLDLAATLSAGRPVAQKGLLAQSDGGIVAIPMAERLAAGTVARLAQALDRGETAAERDGLGQSWPSQIAVLALDEGRDDDPALAAALVDRLAFVVDLSEVGWSDTQSAPASRADVMAARALLPQVLVPDELVQALCATACRMGVLSIRASWWSVRVACAAAALHGRLEVTEEDARLAARLVLAPRATVVPTPADEQASPPPPPEESENAAEEDQKNEAAADSTPETPPESPPEEQMEDAAQALEDRLVNATQAALPAGLLAALMSGEAARGAGRTGALSASLRGGRPMGARAGQPRAGARLNLIETLRAAAPWQRLRAAELAAKAKVEGPRVHVRAGDLRVSRLQQRAATATVFVLDASGSSALHRLAEAKGAINLLLAECYIRRDQVGVIAFRGHAAEVLLPLTRSLVRAKRGLAALPGGGGTPLASGLQAALTMAAQVRRAGAVPVVVLLTDGRANVALDGSPGRSAAEADALLLARQLRAARLTSLLVDTAPQASPTALRLAQAMGADYRLLPHAGAKDLAAAVQALPRQA